MKKVFGLLISIMMLVSPFYVKAVTADDEEINLKDYKTLNLKEVLAQEGIKEDFKNYSETDDQIVIYMFRGNGCHYCQGFLKFLNSITEEYGKYFKLVAFEVWSDQVNSELLSKISDFMGEAAGGVPYIIIGDQVFPGYASSYDDGIKSAIKTLYDSKDRYDVFEAYNDAISEAKREEYAKTIRPIIFNGIFVAIGTCVVCYYVKKQNDALYEKLSSKNNKQYKSSYNDETTYTSSNDEIIKSRVNKKVVKKTTNRKRK